MQLFGRDFSLSGDFGVLGVLGVGTFTVSVFWVEAPESFDRGKRVDRSMTLSEMFLHFFRLPERLFHNGDLFRCCGGDTETSGVGILTT